MGVVANLPKALGLGTRKLFVTTESVTGSAAIATGLTVIDIAFSQCQDSADTGEFDISSIHSISGGTINLGAVTFDPTGPTITNPSVTAHSTAVLATGY